MINSFPRVFVSRREFLRKSAASSASTLLAPHLAAFVPLAILPVRTIRVGLLLPVFPTYPQVGASFLEGMKLFQLQKGLRHDFQLLAAKAQSASGLTMQELEQLCEEERIDAVVSLANPSLADGLQPYLQRAGVPLLISHAGANRVDTAPPSVFYNSLGYWQASWQAGAWATETLGLRAVVVASFYESGYDALHAFEQGLEQRGGAVVGRFVTHVPGQDLGMAALMRRIAAQNADFVYAHYSGSAGADFITAYTSSSYTRGIPLLGSTFLLEDALPGPVRSAIRDLYTISSWSDSLQSEANLTFMKAFRERFGRAADSFAVLGYETAGLLSIAAENAPVGSLVEGLRQAHFEGPRGALVLDNETQSVAPPLYLRQVRWQSGAYGAQITESLPAVSEHVAGNGRVRTGWLNPYLGI